MKAACIYRTKVNVRVKSGKRIVVAMDLYKLSADQKGYPEGYKFSWIAFDPTEPSERVLFDVHPPKGPHLHIDKDAVGAPYEWKNLAEAEDFFVTKIQERFGEIIDEENE